MKKLRTSPRSDQLKNGKQDRGSPQNQQTPQMTPSLKPKMSKEMHNGRRSGENSVEGVTLMQQLGMDSSDSSLTPLSSILPTQGTNSPVDSIRKTALRQQKLNVPGPALVLANPFKKVKDDEREAFVQADLDEIRKEMPVLPKPVVQKTTRPRMTMDSDDNCTACLGKGELLCCDNCPRVFHFSCVEEGFDELSPPEGIWLCRICKFNKREPEEHQGLFGPLLDALDATLPRSYSLPLNIRESFEAVFSHPMTGAFEDMRQVIVTRADKPRTTRSSNRGSKDTPEPVVMCHHCSKTGKLFSQTNFLYSHSIAQPKQMHLQAQRSELIKCDYCPLYWHLDCMNPPLASIPHQLLDDQKEWIDMGEVAMLKSEIWKGSHPLDTNARLSAYTPVPHDVLHPRTMYALERAAIGSPILNTYRYLQMRPRWMCPCHADWDVPRPTLKNRPEKIERQDKPNNKPEKPEEKQQKRKFKIVYKDQTEKQKSPSDSPEPEPVVWDLRNNGFIEIDNATDTMDYYNDKKRHVEEKQVILSFFKKQKTDRRGHLMDHDGDIYMTPELAEKFAEFDQHYESRLVREGGENQDWDKHVRAVDDAVKGVESENKEHAAAMLLLHLDAFARVANKD